MISALMACAACSDGSDDFADGVAPENKVNPGQMVIRLGRTLSRSGDLAANTRLFQFHADSVGLGNGGFVEEPALTPMGDDRLTFNLGEGVWNFSLVSSREPLEEGTITKPEYSKRAQDCPMYSMRSENNTLQNAPELFTALVDNFRFSGKWQVTDPDYNIDEFVPDRDYTVDAQMVRNVAKVVVRFKSSEDLDPSQQQIFTITNVPSTLNWRGGLYPDKDNPEISAQPLRGAFDVRYETTPEDNKTISDQEFEYIIPAHRGLDYSASEPVDTTTCLLRLNVDFTCLDGTHVVKNNIVLGYAPRVNGVYDVYVSYNKRKLNVEAQILPWSEESADADVSNAEIVTDKPKVEFAYRDTIRIDSRRPVTLTKAGDASWLTVKKISDTMYALEADVTTYEVGHPRSSYITLRDGNLERRIPVTQRPDEGTIEVHETGTVSNREMWVSPPHPTRNVDVTSISGGWKILPNLRVYNTPTGGAGKTENVTLTRFNDSDVDFSDYNKAFGRERVIFMNTETLDTASIWVDNLFIGLTDDIVELEQPEGTTYKDITTDLIKVAGGSRGATISKYPNFVDENYSWYDKNTGLFHFRSLSNPSGDDRYDTITLAHETDPDYTVTLWLDQVIMVNTPEFDYFVVKFTWASKDVDIRVGFTGNPNSQDYHGQTYSMPNVSSFNNKWCGWSQNNANGYNITLIDGSSKQCLRWGGDATGGQGETVFFNAKELNTFPYPGMKLNGLTDAQKNKMIPRVMKLECRAGWYTSRGSGPITCTVYFYRGGTMVQSGTNFNNSGGIEVKRQSFSMSTSTRYNPGEVFCTVEYDRKRHTARFTKGANAS